ncbi:hypothetical protein GGF50DRAFT_107843 [Schizophyllum commune]
MHPRRKIALTLHQSGSLTDVTMHTASDLQSDVETSARLEFSTDYDSAQPQPQASDSEAIAEPEAPQAVEQPSRRRPVLKAGRRENLRGKLVRLMQMPVEMVYEVFQHLNPPDLLNVARTNKGMRGILLNPNAQFVWTEARKHVQAPPPPAGRPEHRWASLLFEKQKCRICNHSGVSHMDWLLLMRICYKCQKTNLIKESRFAKEFPRQDQSVLDLILFTDERMTSRGVHNFYLRSDIVRMLAQVASYQKRIEQHEAGAEEEYEQFRQRRFEFVEAIWQHSDEYVAWEGYYRSVSLSEGYRLADERRAAIKEQLLFLGHDGRDVEAALNNSKMNIDKKELTEAAWGRIRVKWEEEVRRQRSIREEMEHLRPERERLVTQVYYAKYWKADPPVQWNDYHHLALPLPYEIFQIPSIKMLIEANVDKVVTPHQVLETLQHSATQIEDLRAKHLDFLAKLSGRIREGIAQAGLLSQPQLDSLVSPAQILGLKIAQCDYKIVAPLEGAHEMGMGLRQFLTFWRFYPNRSYFPPAILCWEALSHITFNKKRSVVVASLLDAAKAPRTSAFDDIALGPRFYCLRTPINEGPRSRYKVAFTWQYAMVHFMQCHADLEADAGSWHALSSEDTHRVYTLEGPVGLRAKCWSCAHCSAHWQNLKSYPEVQAHFQAEHGDREWTRRDAVFLPVGPLPYKPVPCFETHFKLPTHWRP